MLGRFRPEVRRTSEVRLQEQQPPRAALKRQINELLGAVIVEEKSYANLEAA